MNIKEVEKKTGISKQNIRFYESKGLISVSRNKDNSYREYSEEDVLILNKIKLLRKLDFSIEEILNIKKTNNLNVEDHIESLKTKLFEYEEMIKMCESLKSEDFNNLNTDKYLEVINESEKNGHKFNSFKDDFKAYWKHSYKKEFTFYPVELITTKEEFTLELLKFAKEKNKDITIVTECMSPDFILDGILYNATRYTSRYGSYVVCKIKREEDLPELEMSKSRKLLVKFCYHILPSLLIVLILSAGIITSQGPIWLKALLIFVEICLYLPYLVIYGRNSAN